MTTLEKLEELIIIAQSGETVTILNDKKFRPKIWTVQEAAAL